MDYRLTDEDKERIKLLNQVSKKSVKILSLEQLIRLQELLENKDYSNQKKANKSKKKLLKDIPENPVLGVSKNKLPKW